MINTKNRKRVFVIVAGCVTALLTICLYVLSLYKPNAETARVSKLENRDILQTQGAVGTITFAHTHDVICAEEYTIEKIYVNIGDLVQIGDPIFMYQSEELDSQIKDYTELLEKLEQENLINEQKINADSAYTEVSLKTAVSHAEAEYQQAQNLCNDLSQRLSVYQQEHASFVASLDECNAAIQAQTDETELERLTLNAQIYHEKIDLYNALIVETQTSLSAAQMQLTQMDYALQTARNELNHSGTSSAQQQSYHKINKKLAESYQEILTTLNLERENLTVYSDFSGIVTEITAVEGEAFFQQNVCKISESEDLTAEFEISADKRYAVETGMNVYLTTEALGNREFVSQISDITSNSNGSYMIHVTVDDTMTDYVKAGMAVYARIVLNEMQDTLAVPYEAILYEDGKAYVLLLKNDTVSKAEVTVLMDSDYYVGITSNQLTEQDIILLDTDSYAEEE